MFKHRSDAYYCYDICQLMRIYPYIFKRRCDSQVFYEITYDITNLTKFVKEYNNKIRDYNDNLKEGEVHKYALRVTSAILIAFARILALRPKVNRFIKNKATWQRKEISEAFVVKKSLDEDSPELIEELVFDPYAEFDDYVRIIENYIDRSVNADTNEANENEIIMGNVFKFLPKWLLTLVLSILNFKDRIHGVGKWLHKIDSLHSSLFVANLSSLGVSSSAPHHHLYEWGTTSIFCILGPVERERIKDSDGKLSGYKDKITISFTVDERICDGFYFIQTLRIIGDYLSNPEKMLHVPTQDEIPHLMTKTEYKSKIKEMKKQIKLNKKKRSKSK